MNLTLTELDFKTAMQSLDSVETGNELLNQLDFVVAKLAEEETVMPVAEPTAWLTGQRNLPYIDSVPKQPHSHYDRPDSNWSYRWNES